MRAAFFALKQGKTSMRDYVQKARHLVSCIDVNPIDMATQVHVFIFGMREGMTRYCLVRAEPKTLEQAFALALREDYTVASSYAKPMSAEARVSAPEPMEIDAVEASAPDKPRGFQSFRGDRGGRGGRGGRGQGPLTCFRCQKQGHRAAVCRAPAPVLVNIEAADMSAADMSGASKNGEDQ
ncbi:hypothetical protein V7S43_009325 [Phytophthora oleae]|uniref:CCHC-type domain-containing protein n=1 Tax=Phytophthora oleae TaxID=2107226 RepID=A0ABD3FJ27_9STRA